MYRSSSDLKLRLYEWSIPLKLFFQRRNGGNSTFGLANMRLLDFHQNQKTTTSPGTLPWWQAWWSSAEDCDIQSVQLVSCDRLTDWLTHIAELFVSFRLIRIIKIVWTFCFLLYTVNRKKTQKICWVSLIRYRNFHIPMSHSGISSSDEFRVLRATALLVCKELQI